MQNSIKVDKPSHSQNKKPNKKVTAKTKSFAKYKKGEQLPLFEIPPATADPVITRSLYQLQKRLDDMGIQTENYDAVYEAAVNIAKFVAAKEKRGIEQAQKESEA